MPGWRAVLRELFGIVPTLDLHGLGVREALTETERFVRDAHANGVTQIRIVYGNRMGPVREVQAGSGYWSQNGAVQVFGISGAPTEVWVRWPGGSESRVPVIPGAREVVVRP